MQNVESNDQWVSMVDAPKNETGEEFTARIVSTIEAQLRVVALRD